MSILSKKLFGYVPSLEALEEPVPEPAAVDDVTIPEGGDAPETTEESSNEPKDQTQSPEADSTDQPADAAPEVADGAGSSDVLSDGESGNGDDDANAEDDTPIELVDPEEMNVEDLLREEQAQEEAIEAQQIQRESVEDAVSESKNLVQAIEGLREAILAGTGTGPRMTRSFNHQLIDSRARLGFTDPMKGVALEESSRDHLTNAKVALESFRSTLRAILERVIKAIQVAIAWLIKWAKETLNNVRKIREQTVQLREAVLKQREKDKEGILHRALGGNTDQYVNTSVWARTGNMAASSAARVLKIRGEQPTNYEVALKEVLQEIQAHKGYPKVFSDAFVERIEDIFQVIVADKQSDQRESITAPLIELFSEHMRPIQNADLQGVSLPAGIASRPTGFVHSDLLGDTSFFHFVSRLRTSDVLDEIEAMKNWKFMRSHVPHDNANDGWLRYLTNEEIVLGSEMVGHIETELLGFSTTVDQIERSEAGLNDILKRAKDILAPMEYTQSFFDEKNEEQGWKGPMLTELVAMLQAVVGNLGAVVSEYQRYGQTVCISWNLYLQAILAQEAQMLAEARKESNNATMAKL